MPMPQAEQSSQMTTSFPPQPTRASGPALAKRTIFGSETSTSILNPLAPTFTTAPNLAGASRFNASTATSFTITPSTGAPSSTESHKFTAFTPTSDEPSTSIPQQITQEQPISDTIAPEIPLVSSPPSMDTVPLEGVLDQTTPSRPPPLTRRQPISLPSTPTATVFIPPSLPSTRKSIFGSLRNIQTTPLSAAPTEILSPLVLHSPATKSLSPIPALSRRESMQSPLKAVVSAADVEGEVEPSAEKLNASLVSGPAPAKKPSLDIMKAMALHFARRGWLVKRAFSKWRQRLSDHAKWIEACRRSTLYKEKARTGRLSRSIGSSPSADERTHRRTPSETRAPLKKRLRERLSGEYRLPANDEELARRFEKVKPLIKLSPTWTQHCIRITRSTRVDGRVGHSWV